MPIILPKKSFEVFGRTVEFSSKEMLKWKIEGVPVDSEMLEAMLCTNGIDYFSENHTPQDIHDICTKAIEDWIYATHKTIEITKKIEETL